MHISGMKCSFKKPVAGYLPRVHFLSADIIPQPITD
jgi:hypothetical protein